MSSSCSGSTIKIHAKGVAMVAQLVPERQFRGPGCTDACEIVKVIVPGRYGRSDLLLHDPAAHEDYGARVYSSRYAPGGVVETGPLAVDLGRCEIRLDGTPVLLTPTETRFLLALARRAGSAASSQYLIEEAWNTDFLFGGWQENLHVLRVVVSRTRVKLGRAGDLIATLKGFGFRLEMVAPGAERIMPRRRLGGATPPGWWAREHRWCVCCGTTDVRHWGHGRCDRCYSRVGGRPHYGPCQAPPVETTPGGHHDE